MELTGSAALQGGLVIFCTIMVTMVGLPLALVVFPVQFYRSVSVCPSVCLPACLPACLPVCLPACLSLSELARFTLQHHA